MHYFIEQSNLTQQNAADTFGAEPSEPTNKFNITSRFQLTNQAKAFACQDGMMIIQQSDVDATLVNVIIKPIENLKVNLNNIKYFVYRGILKNSLIINDNTIVAEAPTNNEFIARLWQDYNHYKTQTNQPSLPNPTPKVFGYNNSLPTNLNIEKIYDNSQDEAQAMFVKQGEWFGEFATTHKIGFEIVTSNERINIDLAYLKKEKHQIDATELTGLELKAKREEILLFIDPCAFWGLHYDYGVNISTYSGGQKTTEKKNQDELFSLLIDNFHTKNRVYLDVRSEFGYSYNFYQNYDDGTGKNIKIGNSATIPIAENYGMLGYGWPIISLDNPINTNNNFNDIIFQLRIDDNTKPILFIEFPEFLADDSLTRFIDDTKLLDGVSTDWSKEIRLKFPNIGSDASQNNVAYYIRLRYFRQEYNSISPNSILKYEKYYQSIFHPINIKDVGITNSTFQRVSNPNYQFVRGFFPNTSNEYFGHIGENGVIWDNSKIVFYSKIIYRYQSSNETIPKTPSFATKSGLNITGNFPQLSFLYNDISILSNKINETGVGDIEILETIHHSEILPFKENVILLCITQDEFNNIKSVSGLSSFHNSFIYLEETLGSPFNDNRSIPFRKFDLKIQGLDTGGNSKIVSTSPLIKIYTKDGFTFNSSNYSLLESIDNKLKISSIYGGFKVFEWIGYINDERETNVVQLIENTCITIPSISPTLLYTIAAGEGLILWIDSNYDTNPPYNVLIQNTIDGFVYLGTDDFGSDFFRYQQFLPDNYNEGDEFTTYNTTNEHGETVISANFKNLESGLLGIGSVIAHRKNKFITDALDLGYNNPNIDQIVYWTYVYFQGEGRAKTYLSSNKGFDYTKSAPSNMRQVRKLALERLATWRYIKINNYFTQ